MPPENEAAARRAMAWWMYRADRPLDAEKELNAAWQGYPQETLTQFELAWVLSDLGRQADAMRAQAQFQKECMEGGEWMALEALISWRTDAKPTAMTAFRGSARYDPVWLEPQWAANNYSPAAAKEFADLRAAELARRRKEALRAVHPVGAAKSN